MEVKKRNPFSVRHIIFCHKTHINSLSWCLWAQYNITSHVQSVGLSDESPTVLQLLPQLRLYFAPCLSSFTVTANELKCWQFCFQYTSSSSHSTPMISHTHTHTYEYIYIYIYKRGAGEGWKRSVGPIMWEMKKYYLQSRSRGISYMK